MFGLPVFRVVPPLESGGYDYEFVDSVPDRFICSICCKVMRYPHLVVCCGQKYCHSCLQKWLRTQPFLRCPYCRASGEEFEHVVEKGMKREIESFHIKCSNHDKGCEWIGELRNLSEHLKESNLRLQVFDECDNGCGYVEIGCRCHWKGECRKHKDHIEKDCLETLVQCSNKCQGGNTKVLRKNLAYHLKERCEARHYTCSHCLGSRFGTSHDVVCPKFPVSCPNFCYQEGLVRDSIESHRLVCKYEIIGCKYGSLGCTEKVRRQDMPQHLVSHQGQHLEMIEKDYEKLKAELNKMKIEVAEKEALIHQEIKLAEKKFGVGWPFEFEDLFASLKTQSGKCQINLGTELTFRMLSFQEIIESKVDWQSSKFTLLQHTIQLNVKGCGQPNSLALELWNTIPHSLHNSAGSLRIIVKAKKPAFKNLTFSPLKSPSPQNIDSRIPPPSRLSFPVTSNMSNGERQNSLSIGQTSLSPGHANIAGRKIDCKQSGSLFYSTEKKDSLSKPNVINWDNPILANPSSSNSDALSPITLATSGVLSKSMASGSAMEFSRGTTSLQSPSASTVSSLSTSSQPSPLSTMLSASSFPQPKIFPATTQSSSLLGAGSAFGSKVSQPLIPSQDERKSSNSVFSESRAITTPTPRSASSGHFGSNTPMGLHTLGSSNVQPHHLTGVRQVPEPLTVGSECQSVFREDEKRSPFRQGLPSVPLRSTNCFAEVGVQTEKKQSPSLVPQSGPYYFDFRPILPSEVRADAEPGSEHLLCRWVVKITPEWEETFVESNSILWSVGTTECQACSY